MTMEGTTEPIEMLTVSDDNVVVEEELSQRNGGWVISFTLTSKCASPVAVRISVPMPDEPARQDVGFHPKHEPESWGLRDGVLSFEDTVPEDEPLQILLGIVLVDDDDTTLTLSEPSIDLSQPMDSPEDRETEEAPIFRSSSVTDADEGMTGIEKAAETNTDPFSGSALEESRDTAEADTMSEAEDPFEQPEQPAPDTEDASSESDDEGETSSMSGIDLESLKEVSEEIHSNQEAEDSTELASDDELTDSDDEASDGFLSPYTEEPESIQEAEDTEPAGRIDSSEDEDEDILVRLVERLEDADPNDEELEAIREHLVPESQRATDVRLQHIQSRMDDLDAYTEALEDLINEHGTASEFMTKVDEDIDDVRSQVKSLRRELDTAETERDELGEQVTEVESTIEEVEDDLRGRTENIYEELDSMRDTIDSRGGKIKNLREAVNDNDDELESLSDRVSTTEDQLEDHRDALDQRLSTLSDQMTEIQRTLESDYNELQEEVESLAEMRNVFARAFADQTLEQDVEGTEESWPDEGNSE